MRIGFDAKRAFMNSSGLGNYSRTLIRSLIDQFPGNKYFAFTPGMKDNLGKELPESPNVKMIFPPQLMRTMFSSLWRSSFVSEDIRAAQLDIFHGLSNELPKRIPVYTKKIVTIHDLIFLRHPEWYTLFDRNLYYKKSKHACKVSDAIVAVSEQTRADIMYFFNTPKEKIHVIYQGVDRYFTANADDKVILEFKRKNNLPEKYILYVGTVEERKDLLTLVKALAELDHAKLVIIGKQKSYSERVKNFIRDHQLESRVIFPGRVSSEELNLFYRGASVFVYPSLYEGFGIPVIEALECGVPVIATGSTALPEAGGPSSLYFNPGDHIELSKKINVVMNDGNLRSGMISAGKKYAKRFLPEIAASQMMDLYSQLAG
jgi:glycosyltransferase involved in cell wall biosynthesis